jgi:hypothetical protein
MVLTSFPDLELHLLARALKNVGFDVAKPDRHINRAAVCLGLVQFPGWEKKCGYETPNISRPADLLKVMQAMEELAKDVNESVTYVDNAIWLLCAKSGAHLTNEELVELAGRAVKQGMA